MFPFHAEFGYSATAIRHYATAPSRSRHYSADRPRCRRWLGLFSHECCGGPAIRSALALPLGPVPGPALRAQRIASNKRCGLAGKSIIAPASPQCYAKQRSSFQWKNGSCGKSIMCSVVAAQAQRGLRARIAASISCQHSPVKL